MSTILGQEETEPYANRGQKETKTDSTTPVPKKSCDTVKRNKNNNNAKIYKFFFQLNTVQRPDI